MSVWSQRYLLLYNCFSWFLWALVLNRTFVDSFIYLLPNVPLQYKLKCVYIVRSAANDPHKLLIAVQNINAVFEIAHVAFGLVRSSLPVTCLQFFARLLITLGICLALPQSPANWTFSSFVGLSFAWTFTELARYGYYILSYLWNGRPPYIFKWIRYTLFIVLYPLGLISEFTTVYLSIPYATGFYHYYLMFGLVLYIPGFIRLYSYMWKQRKRALAPNDKIKST